jgi:hypothetical protein
MASTMLDEDEDGGETFDGDHRLTNTFVLHYEQKSESYQLLCKPESGDRNANKIGWVYDRLHSFRPRDETTPYMRVPNRPLVDLARERSIARDRNLQYLLEQRPLLPNQDQFDSFLAKTERFNIEVSKLQQELARAFRDPFISRLREWSQMIGKLEANSIFARNMVPLHRIPVAVWTASDNSKLEVMLVLMKISKAYSAMKYELDGFKSQTTQTVNHGIQLLCMIFEQEEFELYTNILNQRALNKPQKKMDTEGMSVPTKKKKLWGNLKASVKKNITGRQKAKNDIKIVFLNTAQSHHASGKYHDLFDKKEGAADYNPALLAEDLDGDIVHVLNGGQPAVCRVNTVIACVTKEWRLNDIQQLIHMASKKIVICEMHDGACVKIRGNVDAMDEVTFEDPIFYPNK